MEKDIVEAVNVLLDSIIRASKKVNREGPLTINDSTPEESAKAEAYIRKKVLAIYEAGKFVGHQALTEELFNPK